MCEVEIDLGVVWHCFIATGGPAMFLSIANTIVIIYILQKLQKRWKY